MVMVFVTLKIILYICIRSKTHRGLLWLGREFQDLTKIWPEKANFPLLCDVWHVLSVYVACEGLSDRGHGPNKPTATIIGEYTASYHIMVHWYLLWLGREFQDPLTKIWPNFLITHHCMSGMFPVCMLLGRVVRPWSWTQQAYCNNHWWIQCLIPSWCTDVYSD